MNWVVEMTKLTKAAHWTNHKTVMNDWMVSLVPLLQDLSLSYHFHGLGFGIDPGNEEQRRIKQTKAQARAEYRINGFLESALAIGFITEKELKDVQSVVKSIELREPFDWSLQQLGEMFGGTFYTAFKQTTENGSNQMNKVMKHVTVEAIEELLDIVKEENHKFNKSMAETLKYCDKDNMDTIDDANRYAIARHRQVFAIEKFLNERLEELKAESNRLVTTEEWCELKSASAAELREYARIWREKVDSCHCECEICQNTRRINEETAKWLEERAKELEGGEQ